MPAPVRYRSIAAVYEEDGGKGHHPGACQR
ncbi:hypothetical protein SALBM311S_03217 [Streptomyces alboniger]